MPSVIYESSNRTDMNKCISIPMENGVLCAHFGHCEYFTVFTVDDVKKVILTQETIESPAGCGCKSNIAFVLADMGVTLMIAGNMGEGAVNVLQSNGIEVLRGCSGDVEEVASQWLAGILEDSGDACHQHEHGCHHN